MGTTGTPYACATTIPHCLTGVQPNYPGKEYDVELAWFQRPTANEDGTVNLTYNALDLQVIRGRATESAITGASDLDFAGLLEQVGGVAGAMRGLGVEPGDHVGVRLSDPLRELLVVLAAARLGAVCVVLDATSQRIDEFRPHLVVTDTAFTFAEHVPAAVIVAGVAPVDPARDLDWEVAIKAGLGDPAGCEPVSPRSTAYVTQRPVAVAEVFEDSGRLGACLATLASGSVVMLAGEES